ncbi:MAG: DUF1565 domain-containing protein [Chloroflexi bacterium]|nr:DUF1565 domain-containing protein [Chloroflexota bacterium]
MLVLFSLLFFLPGACILVEPGRADNEALIGPKTRTGQTYYVATYGDDANPGTLNKPWRTIQHAADNVSAGDAVYVRAGVYYETVFIETSGNADHGYITFSSYPGETAILDGSRLSVYEDALFYIENQSYIVIDGFELRNHSSSSPDDAPAGVFITGAAHHIQIKNNNIHHIETLDEANGNAHGIAVYGTETAAIHNILIQDNLVHRLKLGWSESLAINGNVKDFQIIGNVVCNNDNIGIDLIGLEGAAPVPSLDRARDGVVRGNVVYNIDSSANPAYDGERSAGGIYVDGGTGIVIEQNQVFDSNIGIEVASERANGEASYITVQNNLVYRNHITGLAMGGYDEQRGSAHHNTIVNNTFFQNDALQGGNGEMLLQFNVHDNVIENNIVVANDQGLLIGNPFTQNQNNIVDYNLYYSPLGAAENEWQWRNVSYQGFDAYRQATGNDAHSLFADPRFLKASALDFHLQTNSPAMDAADPDVAPPQDFEGRARPQGAGPDMGAYEAVAATSTPTPASTATPTLVPVSQPLYLPVMLQSDIFSQATAANHQDQRQGQGNDKAIGTNPRSPRPFPGPTMVR